MVGVVARVMVDDPVTGGAVVLAAEITKIRERVYAIPAVSYTHLTLPTIYSV